jgi:hypothetical protein
MSEPPPSDEKKKVCPHCGKTGHVRTNHRDCDMNPNKDEISKPDTERCSYYAQGDDFCDALKDGDCVIALRYKGVERYRNFTAADFADDGVGGFVFALFDDDPLLLKTLKDEEVRVRSRGAAPVERSPLRRRALFVPQADLALQAAEMRLQKAAEEVEQLKIAKNRG